MREILIDMHSWTSSFLQLTIIIETIKDIIHETYTKNDFSKLEKNEFGFIHEWEQFYKHWLSLNHLIQVSDTRDFNFREGGESKYFTKINEKLSVS